MKTAEQTEKDCDALREQFPGIKGITEATDSWGGGYPCIHLGDAAEGGHIGGFRAADYYTPDHLNYEMGVHRALEEALEKLGWYAEWYDAGTLLAYEN